DRPPGPAERALCARWWSTEVSLIRPEVVLLAGKMAISEYYSPSPLESRVGTWRREDAMWLLPLPHPSGISRWLNDPTHRALVDRALAQLGIWRIELD